MTLYLAVIIAVACCGGLALAATFVKNWLAMHIMNRIAGTAFVLALFGALALMAYADFTGAHRLGPFILPPPGPHPVAAALRVTAAGVVLAVLGTVSELAALRSRRRRRGYARLGGA